jgi:penicillin-binding protein 2
MLEVVEGDEGTGRAARLPGIQVAGKTGTAQNPHGDDHASFVCFAPFDDPEIAVYVLLENAGHGSSEAAPLARFLLAHYFGLAEVDEVASE